MGGRTVKSKPVIISGIKKQYKKCYNPKFLFVDIVYKTICVLLDNKRAIYLYEKCGFTYEGEFRNHLFLRGEFKMLKWYGILREEYFAVHEIRNI